MGQKAKSRIVNTLSYIGLLASGYLLYIHYAAYNNLDTTSVCHLTAGINCQAVAMSKWSIFAGMPLAYWGVCGFIAYLYFKHSKAPLFAFIVSAAMMATCAFLIYISAKKIGAFCPFCIAVYFVSTVLFFEGVLTGGKSLSSIFRSAGTIEKILLEKLFLTIKIEFSEITKRRANLFYCLPILFTMAVSAAAYPRYWEMPPHSGQHVETGFTETGHPFIESTQTPLITIEEYTDYNCIHCLNGQRLIRRLINSGTRARLVHRNYPLSSECNPLIKETRGDNTSCALALWAVSAMKIQGADAFWSINDAIFSGEDESFDEISKSAKIGVNEILKEINSEESAIILARDIMSGISLGISGTPTYFVGREKKTLDEVVELLKNSAQRGA